METKVKSFDLSREQEEIAVRLYKENKKRIGSYTLEDVDGEMANIWISEAHANGEEDYAEFLREANANGAELYTLTDHLGEFSQSIGEIAFW